MAKLREANPKHTSGAYKYIIGNEEMAAIFTMMQSAVISRGIELEKVIEGLSKNLITNLNTFVQKCTTGKMKNGVYLCTKKVLLESKYAIDGIMPDFLIFKLKRGVRKCYVIELKGWGELDTKKSSGEQASLEAFTKNFGTIIPFPAEYKMCCFYQDDKKQIVASLKKKFTEDQVMTGKELCELLGEKYEDVVANILNDQKDNMEYLVEKIAAIPEVAAKVLANAKAVPVLN